MSTTATTPPRDRRTAHRLTCVAAGGLALLGGALGLFASPWFLSLAIAGGVWLIATGVFGGSTEPTNAAPPSAATEPTI